MTRRAETTVAIVNGLLVLLVPLAVVLIGNSLRFDSDTGVTVRGPVSTRLPDVLSTFVLTVLVLTPFATVAAWRSWVYARRWRLQYDRAWRAVGEAGACGLVVALVVMLPGIVTRPTEAPPYVIAYGGAALLLGLMVGLILRTTGAVVLRLCGSAS